MIPGPPFEPSRNDAGTGHSSVRSPIGHSGRSPRTASAIAMIPVTTFAGRKVAVFGLGGSGLASASALLAGGADVVGWDDSADTVAKATSAGIPTADLRHVDWSRIAALVLAPGRAADPSGAALVGGAGARRRGRGDRRHRAVLPRAPRATRPTRRSSPSPAPTENRPPPRSSRISSRAAGHDVQVGGNIGTAILSLEPPAHGPRARDRGVVLSDRPGAHARPLGRHPDQCQRGSPRPPRHACPLRGRQGAAGRRRAGGRHRDRRRRRQLVPGRGRPHRARRQARGARLGAPAARRRPLCRGRADHAGRGRHRAQSLALLGGIGSLRGVHNAQNAACAAGAALALGLSAPAIQQGLRVVSRPRPPDGAGRPQGTRAVRQRFQGHQRRLRRPGAGLLLRHFLDRGRQAEDRRASPRSPASSRASARPI